MDNQLDLFETWAAKDLTPNKTVAPADFPRIRGQNRLILDRLRMGPATNAELAELSLKYSGRISDLRKHGYAITANRGEGGIWTYELQS